MGMCSQCVYSLQTLKLLRDRVGMEDYINYIDVREQEKYRDKIQTLLANSVSSCCGGCVSHVTL